MNRTINLSETVQDSMLERVTEKTGIMKQGEMFSSVQNANIPPLAVQRETNGQPATVNDNTEGRGRRRIPFYRNTSENDPYDISIAPRNIYENQVIPIGLHNLLKRFRPNSMIFKEA